MDKKLIYFLLGFSAFYFLYYRFVLDPVQKKALPPQKTVSAPAEKSSTPDQSRPAPPVTPPPVTPILPASDAKVKSVVVDTPLYRAELSNQGGALASFRLKKYKDDFGQPLEMIPQSTPGNLPLQLDLENTELSGVANKAVYSVSPESISLTGTEQKQIDLVYSDGVHSFTKSLTFRAQSYLIDCQVSASGAGGGLPVRVYWSPGIESIKSYKKDSHLNPSRGLVNSGEKVEHVDAKDAKEFKKIGSTVLWAGVENNYFLAIFIPASNRPSDAYMNQVPGGEKKDAPGISVFLSGTREEPLRFSLFVGPKDYFLLKQLGMELQDAVDFGFFDPIAKGLFFALRYFYGFTMNYGWAIVLVTILIKIIFTPFTQMSFASMKKMQSMQPEMKKIQDKYGQMKSDDPRKQNMNVEVMQLHKRYGVNPLGGCLPMLLQMPVLIAFYQLLSNAIELRGAPFGWWLQDLSRPDPWKITPLLMGGTMLLQQKMTPTTDPMQKTMMYIMPVMFTFMSFNFPSGLVLYWFFSNILAIAHQYYFQNRQKVVPAT